MVIKALLTALYTVTMALLYPVVIGFLLLLAYLFGEIGAFFSEYTSRNRKLNEIRRGCKKAKEFLVRGEIDRASEASKQSSSTYLLSEFIDKLSEFISKRDFRIEAEKLLQDYEIIAWKKTENERILTRIGPMLGLMGTLIPLSFMSGANELSLRKHKRDDNKFVCCILHYPSKSTHRRNKLWYDGYKKEVVCSRFY